MEMETFLQIAEKLLSVL